MGRITFTGIGLDPADWQQPVNHINYAPSGSRMLVTAESGYAIYVNLAGQRTKLYQGWSFIYDDITLERYYHSISAANRLTSIQEKR